MKQTISKNVIELKGALISCAIHKLDPKNVYIKDIPMLNAMDYVAMYEDQGACMADKVSIVAYHSFLGRAQYQISEDEKAELEAENIMWSQHPQEAMEEAYWAQMEKDTGMTDFCDSVDNDKDEELSDTELNKKDWDEPVDFLPF